jgi:hypothetical protein
MAFNGSGVYNLVMDWVADAAAGIKIRADRHMTQDQDFASGISNCIARDGQSIISANTPWNGKRITNLGDPSAAQDAMTRAYFDAQMALPGVSRAFVQAQVKTTTGSIVLHADTRAFLVEVQGGGGGGNQGPSSASGQGAAAGGGGAGGYCAKWIIRPSGAYSPACSVGAVAAGQAAGNGSQFVDGTSTLTAGGGGVGTLGAAAAMISLGGGAGGSAVGGDINVVGAKGARSIVVNVGGPGGNVLANGGDGGQSRFGGPGAGGTVTTSSATGVTGSNGGLGAGGGGGVALNGGGGYGGGGGGAGIVIITEFQ